jgi:UrcA family protein
MTRLIFSALAITAALVSAMPAAAQDAISVHVSYADLNLGAADGVAVFRHRLDQAVTAICGTADRRDLGRTAIVKACRSDAALGAEGQVRNAIASAQAPMLASAGSKIASR